MDVPLSRPVAVAARLELDAWLLRRATEAGARHVAERVVGVEGSGRLRTGAGRDERFDLIVGADGASSLVRRSFLRRRRRRGWRWPSAGSRGAPRRCSSASRPVSPATCGCSRGRTTSASASPRRSHRFRRARCAHGSRPRSRGSFRRSWTKRRSATRTPSRRPRPTRRSLAEIAGPRWALVGDAAALADPITGEGIYYALRSAIVLADTLLADGSPARYPERALADFGGELLKAAALHDRFYAPGFSRRMVRYAARSAAIRDVLGDLVLGDQGYLGLKRRLLWAGPRFLLQASRPRFSAA